MDSKRITLSKSILEMKFMKRTKDKVEKQQFQEEGEHYFGNELTSRMKKASGKFFIESSYVFCEQLTDGRLSFRGINPKIEKLMEARENEKRAKMETKQETEISDEQMAVQWQKIRVKFDATQRQYKKPQHRKMKSEDDEPIEKKPKFLKPID
ncbi:M-phase phosphoprotein 6 [Linepithema humile]|uniref:M-phase phosphoprotein 6 n=1 Tax=Linepithema humile TaxID=83485 RepID=UPI0006233E9E|nr:PREDICTED: M-phase phosphoprotein 6 [Linepithema humile]